MVLVRSKLAYCGSGFGPLLTCANNIVARQYHQVIAIRQLRQALCLRGQQTIERPPVASLQLARQAAQAMLERPHLRYGCCRL